MEMKVEKLAASVNETLTALAANLSVLREDCNFLDRRLKEIEAKVNSVPTLADEELGADHLADEDILQEVLRALPQGPVPAAPCVAVPVPCGQPPAVPPAERPTHLS